MKFHVETREVLAGAYLHSRSKARMLSHAAVVDEWGGLVITLCRRVSIDSLADAGAQDVKRPPTCARCIAALRKKGRQS